MTATDQQEVGPTKKLSAWVPSVSIQDVPAHVQTRAKYLLLDGIACLIVGANLPWSQKAVRTILSLEPPGSGACSIFGWGCKVSPLQAALLNSTFIQGFELDDWHSEAPLHSNSLLLPSLLAVAQQEAATNKPIITGEGFLLAAILGYEIGPRVGNALWGSHILTAGWHSGAVFGPAAVASAVSTLLQLDAEHIEDALGIACTQACGLMSAQFGSDAKRMQHGFAARNGILAAYLARGGYSGIKNVFETPYGGFLSQFSAGNGKEPNSLPDEISIHLGSEWKTLGVRLKPYASLAATHPTIDCVRALQAKHPDDFRPERLEHITRIVVEMGSDAFHHGGWQAARPLTSLGAQMSCMYCAATQFVDNEVYVAQFEAHMLSREVVWGLVGKMKCVEIDTGTGSKFAQRIKVDFGDGKSLTAAVENARGVDPELSNVEVVEKWRHLTNEILDKVSQKKVEDIVLNLETCKDVGLLADLLANVKMSPLLLA